MDETEWLTGNDPNALLEWVRSQATERKLRLFASSSFNLLRHLLPHAKQRAGIVLLETLADSTPGTVSLRGIGADLRSCMPEDRGVTDGDDLHFTALMLFREFATRTIGHHAVLASSGAANRTELRGIQSSLLRDIFGNPFRPVAFDPAWRSETAVGIAAGIYEDRAFERMPILADALQEAGCEHADILTHCREPGTHVRGCWVVDLVLGKE